MPGSVSPSPPSSEPTTDRQRPVGSGLDAFDEATQQWLGQRAWRHGAKSSRRHGLAWLIVILLHLVFLLIIWHELKPRPEAPVQELGESDVLQVQLLGRTSHEATDNGRPSQAAPTRQPTQPVEVIKPKPQLQPKPKPPVAKPAPSHDAMRVHLTQHRSQPKPEPAMSASVAALAQSHLFDASGQPILAIPSPQANSPKSDYVVHDVKGDSQILKKQDPTHYQATRFDQGWHHRGGVMDDALQKAHDKTSYHHTIRLPKGIRLNCSISLLPPGGGCGGGAPPPPSKKDGDERLSMAPPTSLAKDPHAKPPPSIKACVVAYRADKPLPYGCPVDTPERAVDAEVEDRAAEQRRRNQWGH